MLAVISDLHMEEEASNHIDADPNLPPIHFSRNLSPKAYRKVFADLANEARRNEAQVLRLVLAGDIFELHRTGLWFWENPLRTRPYVSVREVDESLERVLLAILAGILAEPENGKSLEVIRLLAQGQYWDEGELRPFPVPVELHYLPGNHDRLANSTPAVRRQVRQMLGLPATPEPFPHVLYFPEEQTLVRHGQEYDHYNFATDLRQRETVPTYLPPNAYGEAPFGDFITVDVASALPFLIRSKFGDGGVQADPVLRAVYERSIAFDDLRPQQAMLQYLLHMPEKNITPAAVWSVIDKVIDDLLEGIYDDPFLREWMRRMNQTLRPDLLDAVEIVLGLRVWRWTNIPLPLVQFLSRKAAVGSGDSHPEQFAAREEMIQHGEARYVIAGHTHHPKIELLRHDQLGERYYIDTGTWRNRVPANPDYTAFGSLKTLTYVVVYGAEEDRGGMALGAKMSSVDIWSGFTQRW